MNRNLLSSLIFILLCFLLNFSPASGSEFYDENGKNINEAKYEKIINNRKSKIDKIQKEGYSNNVSSLKDPILFRKKRIEQWKLLRKSKD